MPTNAIIEQAYQLLKQEKSSTPMQDLLAIFEANLAFEESLSPDQEKTHSALKFALNECRSDFVRAAESRDVSEAQLTHRAQAFITAKGELEEFKQQHQAPAAPAAP